MTTITELGILRNHFGKILKERSIDSILNYLPSEFRNAEQILEENEIALNTKPNNLLFSKKIECVSEISDVFVKNNLRFFFMKTFRSYPYIDKDMDFVCVDKEKIGFYLSLLKDLGYSFLWNKSILREPGKRFYVRRDKENKTVIPYIHVHFSVTWNGIQFLDPVEAWKRLRTVKINEKEIKVPSIEDEILILAAHSLHENTYLTIGELLHLSNLFMESSKLDIKYMNYISGKFNWNRALKNFLSYSDCYYEYLTGSCLLNGDIKEELNNIPRFNKLCVSNEVPMCFLPKKMLLSGYILKIVSDLCRLRLVKLPRELFTFCMVIWLFRSKKIDKLKKLRGK